MALASLFSHNSAAICGGEKHYSQNKLVAREFVTEMVKVRLPRRNVVTKMICWGKTGVPFTRKRSSLRQIDHGGRLITSERRKLECAEIAPLA